MHGVFDPPKGVIDVPLHRIEGEIRTLVRPEGKPSVTEYQEVERFGKVKKKKKKKKRKKKKERKK